MKSLLVHSNEFALDKTRTHTRGLTRAPRQNSCTRTPRLRFFEERAHLLEHIFELLLPLEHRPEQIALALNPLQHVPDVEVGGLDLPALNLRPFERRG